MKDNYIFKICRVHNIVDLKTVVNNGANMIGIYAVYFDKEKYIDSEKKYKPVYSEINENDDLPIAYYEIDSIKQMQKNINQAILFQKSLPIEKMKKCIEIYNMPINNTYIQLHYRTNKQEIVNMKEKLCNKIIAVTGIYQDDFLEYFNFLQNELDFENDYILIDLSIINRIFQFMIDR